MLAIIIKKQANLFQHLNLKNNNFGAKDIDFLAKKLEEQILSEIKQENRNKEFLCKLEEEVQTNEELIAEYEDNFKAESCLASLNLSKNPLTGCRINEFIKYLQIYCKLEKININSCQIFQGKKSYDEMSD